MTAKLCAAALMAAASCAPAFATVYEEGVSPALSSYPAGTVVLGTHLANYIGPTAEEGNGTALDGTRVYLNDVNDPAGLSGPLATANFNLLVWQFDKPKDTVRLYTHQDHYFGGPVGDALAPEVLEYSIFGCKSAATADMCKSQAGWTLLSDPVSWTLNADSNPIYNFHGTAAAVVYRGGSAEFGLVNAYVQDYTLADSYDFFAIRGSSIAMQANTADPELDAMAAYNRIDVPIPEPGTWAMFAAGLGALMAWRRRRS
jgi:hypothetical protein